MSSSYGMRDHPVLRQRRRHNGVDLAAPTGTPIYATADGIVGRADWFSSYGLYVSIDHGAVFPTHLALTPAPRLQVPAELDERGARGGQGQAPSAGGKAPHVLGDGSPPAKPAQGAATKS